MPHVCLHLIIFKNPNIKYKLLNHIYDDEIKESFEINNYVLAASTALEGVTKFQYTIIIKKRIIIIIT